MESFAGYPRSGASLQALTFLKASWLPKIRVEPSPDPELIGDCLLWLGARNADGYPVVWWEGRCVYLHRLAYEKHTGDILGEREGDHLCFVRNCFQPAHIEPASRLENADRGMAKLYRKAGLKLLTMVDYQALADMSWSKLKPPGMLY